MTGTGVMAILAERLSKRYGTTTALDAFDLAVPQGQVWAMLGPNGAGKTTAIRVLATLVRPDGGQATVAGFDVVRQAEQVRYRIGLVGQHAAVDEILTGRQNLEMFGRLYHLPAEAARRRATELLERFDLGGAADRPVVHYSGGMRRRLDLAAGLIVAPPILYLDEPTTGLDPSGRNEVWAAVRTLVESGTTVLLTTQYLGEADQLSHGVVVIDRGRVIAVGTPNELKSRLGGDRIDVVVRRVEELAPAARLMARVADAEPDVDADSRLLSAPVTDRVRALGQLLRGLEQAGIEVDDIASRRPTLDEVFLHLTDGQEIRA